METANAIGLALVRWAALATGILALPTLSVVLLSALL